MYAWKDFVIENNDFSNEIKQGSIFEAWCVSNPTFKNNTMNNFKDIGTVLARNFYTKKDGVIVKIPGQDYEPNYSYVYEQNITDFYNNSAINMDNAILTINKGITTPFPAASLNISGKDMELQ
jgi:hypothetical protein